MKLASLHDLYKLYDNNEIIYLRLKKHFNARSTGDVVTLDLDDEIDF